MNGEPAKQWPDGIGAPGFADPVKGSQRAFRDLMNAMAHPALAHAFSPKAHACGPLAREAAAIMLALVDQETPLWLDDTLAQSAPVRAFIAFHCGAPVVSDPKRAAFAFLSASTGLCPLDRFAQGEPDYPDRSTTVVAQTAAFSPTGYSFAGPGIPGARQFAFAPAPSDFARDWLRNASAFPLGVDLFLSAPGVVAAMPRSLRIVKA